MTSLGAILASQILSYSGGQQHIHDFSLAKRFRFTNDPSQGDASLTVTDVRASDTNTYQCKVKKLPGTDARKVTLVVLGEEQILVFSYRSNLFAFSALFFFSNVLIHVECKGSAILAVSVDYLSVAIPRCFCVESEHRTKIVYVPYGIFFFFH